jgi:DNA polymerase III subunit gamma/tau
MAGDVPSAAADPAPSGAPAAGAPAAPAALYRRYRPATFAELKGQDHVTEPLRQALRSGRVHHAYLFSGPRGCGKTSSARILARSLNCEQGPTPDPCGKCASCVALAPSGPGSIDVIEIDAASHGGVDDARDLRERAFYAPVAARFKIYIVDEAHMVTREGFNALLKLVEEPPPHLKFVFATTEPEKVIATIRSRTHHYPFRLMPPAVLRGLLEEILASEGVHYEPAVLTVVVRAGAGSARDALSVLDQLLAGSDESGLTYERAVALLGYTDENLLDEVVEAFASGDGAAVFRAVDRVMEGGHDPRRFATDLLDRFRDLIVLAAVPDAGQTGLLDVPSDRLDRMREQAASFGQAQLTKGAETINAGLTEMRGATSPRLQLELICAQVLLPAPSGGEQELLARLERLERRLGSGGADPGHAGSRPEPREAYAPRGGPAASPAPRPAPAAPAAPSTPPVRQERSAPAAPADAPPQTGALPQTGAPPQTGARPAAAAGGAVDAGSLREQWPTILEAVKHHRRVAWLLLNNATPDTLKDGILTLMFTREGEARGFSGSGYDRDLSQVLENMLGISPKIRAMATGTPGGRGAGAEGGPGFGSGGAGSGGAGPGGAGSGGAGPGGAGQTGGGSGFSGADTGAGSAERGADQTGGGYGRSESGPPGAGDAGLDGGGAGSTGDGADSTDGHAGQTRGGSRSSGRDADPADSGGPGPGGSRPAHAGGNGDADGVSADAGTGAVQARDGAPAGGGRAAARATAAARAAARGAAERRGPRREADRAGQTDAEPEYPDESDHAPAPPSLTGLDLIQRTLGGEVIAEIGDN